MSLRTVTTQAELDRAIADKVDWIEIRSLAGVWLEVTAYGSSTVTAYDSSTVTATPLVAVHLHAATVHVTGGTILDHTKVSDFTAQEWCDYHGVEVAEGIATLFKAVDNQWTTVRGVDYSPGSLPSCDDFRDTDACGNGLHFGPTPTHALAYHPEASRFVAVGVLVSELRPITGSTAKAKAPRVVRACVEAAAATGETA